MPLSATTGHSDVQLAVQPGFMSKRKGSPKVSPYSGCVFECGKNNSEKNVPAFGGQE